LLVLVSASFAATITTFDVPGATNTYGAVINDGGTIAGSYIEGGTTRGFVRDADGTIVTFDVPGSTSTEPSSINKGGTITGLYVEGGTTNGFVRDADGTIVTFDPSGSINTYDDSINNGGTIAGIYEDDIPPAYTIHGFVREPHGTFVTFDPPALKVPCPMPSIRAVPSRDGTLGSAVPNMASCGSREEDS